MKLHDRLSVIVLFTSALLIGIIFTPYIPSILALSIDDYDFKELVNLPGLDTFKGPKGDKGDPGPNKEFDIITVSNSVQSNHIGSLLIKAEVICPDDTQVTGGGFDVEPKENDYTVVQNKPYNNGWVAEVYKNTGIVNEFTLMGYAQCGKLVDPGL